MFDLSFNLHNLQDAQKLSILFKIIYEVCKKMRSYDLFENNFSGSILMVLLMV